eukprot:Gb_26598 [translate_table: standard]
MASWGSLEECLKLLRGERDEQRLAGLLLATKFCQGDDRDSILKVFDALGMRFLDRLLKTGMGQTTGSAPNKDQQEAYLQLAITIFAAFCRVPELASLEDIISKVPVILETLASKSEHPVAVECYECLLEVATASDKGFLELCESKAMPIIANHLYSSPPDSPSIQLALRLMQFLLAKMPTKMEIAQYVDQVASVAVALGRQFAMQQTSLKFDALHLLSTLLASEYLAPVRSALQSSSRDPFWPTYVRVGIGTILQNRVVADQKHLALVVAESMMETFGEGWLIGPMNLPGDKDPIPSDRCLLLVLETSRVEIDVILNELARLKFESNNGVASSSEEITLKQRNLANAYALIENIIKLISNAAEKQDNSISETSMVKAMTALNESVGVVFDFLQDAKDHGITKGDDLLASIRIVGRYLAETPSAYNNEFQKLLEYILSVTGEDEDRPVVTVQFLLPTLCQTTMDADGCNVLVSCGGHKQVVECLSRLLQDISQEISGIVLLACDTIMNILLKRDEMQPQLNAIDFIPVLPALAAWAGEQNSSMVLAMASSICTLVLDLTSEESLLKLMEPHPESLNIFSNLIIKTLELCQQGESLAQPPDEQDLYDITVSGCAGLLSRYPSIKQAIRTSSFLQQVLQNRTSMETITEATSNPSLQALLDSIIS